MSFIGLEIIPARMFCLTIKEFYQVNIVKWSEMMSDTFNSIGLVMSTIAILAAIFYLGYAWLGKTHSKLAIYSVGVLMGFLIRTILTLGNPF